MELLDLCRTTEEIVAILDEDGSEEVTEAGNHSLARVRLALKYEQKRVRVNYMCNIGDSSCMTLHLLCVNVGHATFLELLRSNRFLDHVL